MWADLDCESCGGSGFEPTKEPGFWLEGVFYSGTFPCGDCNGSGKQRAWFDPCQPCRGSGKDQAGADCKRCNGLGFHEPAPSSKVSRWEEVTDI